MLFFLAQFVLIKLCKYRFISCNSSENCYTIRGNRTNFCRNDDDTRVTTILIIFSLWYFFLCKLLFSLFIYHSDRITIDNGPRAYFFISSGLCLVRDKLHRKHTTKYIGKRIYTVRYVYLSIHSVGTPI